MNAARRERRRRGNSRMNSSIIGAKNHPRSAGTATKWRTPGHNPRQTAANPRALQAVNITPCATRVAEAKSAERRPHRRKAIQNASAQVNHPTRRSNQTKAASGLRMAARTGVIHNCIVDPERCTSNRTIRPVVRFDSKYEAVHWLDNDKPSALIRRSPGRNPARAAGEPGKTASIVGRSAASQTQPSHGPARVTKVMKTNPEPTTNATTATARGAAMSRGFGLVRECIEASSPDFVRC